MQRFTLSRAIQVLFFLFLLFCGLFFAREFLIPVTIAGLLSMLFLPLSKKLEKRGFGKGLSAIISIVLLLLFLGGIIALLSWQMAGIAEDAEKMEMHIKSATDNLMQTINNNFGISPARQQELLKKQSSGAQGSAGSMFMGFVSSLTGMLVDFVLVLVYLFLFLYFRGHIKKFILKLAPPENNDKTEKVVYQCSQVAQKYLTGLGSMIVILWVMYGIGFSIVGVKNALFFAVLCGLLEIVPFVGNVTGTLLTLLMVLTQGGGTGMLVGVLITYATVQFVQTYILEPLVVGAEVNINPLFTIMVLVVGELVWGIAGMILAIPFLGITKIICDNVEGLQPYGFLIGEEKGKSKEGSLKEKIKGWFK